MKIPAPFALVFDCACSSLSLAVLRGQEILASHAETTATGQAALLAPAIETALRQAGIAAKDLALIGVTNGPGSFTGIRIGLAMARGLALALQAPLAVCSTFEAVRANLPAAQRERGDADLILAIDSRRDEIFLSRADAGAAHFARPDAMVAGLAPGRYGLAGDAAPQMHAAFAAAGRSGEIAFADDRPPIAANFAPALVAQGLDYWRERNAREGMPRPLYLREADVTLPKSAAR